MINEFSHKKESNTNTIIVFVHGLSGSHKTWKNNWKLTIYDYLFENIRIMHDFGYAFFRYKSNIFNINSRFIYLKSFIQGKNEQVQDVDKITSILYSHLTTSGIRDKKIIFMAHSLGTIVVKKFILKYKDDTEISNRIKLFFSFASPFYGSKLASHRSSILRHSKTHKQINIMEPGSDYLKALNESWINCPDVPSTFQFVAVNDQVVKKDGDNYPLNLYKEKLIETTDDHFSIIKPKYGKSSIILNKIVDELNEYAHENFYRNIFVQTKAKAATGGFILSIILFVKKLKCILLFLLKLVLPFAVIYLSIKYLNIESLSFVNRYIDSAIDFLIGVAKKIG